MQLAEVVFRRRRALLCRIADGSGFLTLRFFHFSAAQQEALARGARLRCFGEVRRGPGRPRDRPSRVPQDRARRAVGGRGGPDAGLPDHRGRAAGTDAAAHRRSRSRSCRAAGCATGCRPRCWARSGLPSLEAALGYVHRPPPHADLEALNAGRHPAQRRLAFEELLAHQLSLRQLRQAADRDDAWPLPPRTDCVERCLERLPFSLTGAQRRAWDEIERDLAREHPMMRLVQGDVGSGKTVVAALAALRAVEHGAQAALMAPTELLAEQHARNFLRLVRAARRARGRCSPGASPAARARRCTPRPRGRARCRSRSARTRCSRRAWRFDRPRARDRRRAAPLRRAAAACSCGRRARRRPLPAPAHHDGDADPAHAGDDGLCRPRRLGHRRAAARPHAGAHRGAARGAARRGGGAHRRRLPRRAPGLLGLPADRRVRELRHQAAEETAAALADALPGVRIGLVHGRMPAARKDAVMSAFKAGELDLLVATTVIEVGVDVPNASLMVIENAERMGLAQLHQLRGRVGPRHGGEHLRAAVSRRRCPPHRARAPRGAARHQRRLRDRAPRPRAARPGRAARHAPDRPDAAARSPTWCATRTCCPGSSAPPR